MSTMKIATRTTGDTVSTASKFFDGIPHVTVVCDRKLKALALSVERIDIPVARSSASITIVSVHAGGAIPGYIRRDRYKHCQRCISRDGRR